MTLLLSAAGVPMVTQGGFPLLPGGPNAGAGVSEPETPSQPGDPTAPSTWTQVFYDDFAGTSLDGQKWKIRYADGTTANGAMQWDAANSIVNNGLTLRIVRSSNTYYGGGIQMGSTELGTAGWSDFQVTIKARFPQGKGIGAYAAMIPVSNAVPPQFDVFETPSTAKDSVRVTWKYPGNASGISQTYSVNATVDRLYTVRRSGSTWNYWIDGVEQAVPPGWAQNPDTARMVLSLGNFVASSGDLPDATTPSTWDGHISYVRVYAPPTLGGGTGGDATPLQRVKAWRADLRLGLNIERNTLVRNGLVTTAVLQGYKDNGATHVRFTVGAFGGFPSISNVTEINPHLDACERAMAVGLKVHLDLLDEVSPSQWSATGLQSYLSAAASAIVARDWDTSKYVLGAAHAYVGGTNEEHRTARDESLTTLRNRLPNTILVSAAGEGSSPYALTHTSYRAPNDALVIHQFQLHHDRAADYDAQLGAANDVGNMVAAWEQAGDRVAYAAHWAVGPSSGTDSSGVVAVDTDDYYKFPITIQASARASLWRHAPAFWVVTDGVWWSLNVRGGAAGDAAMRSAVATEMKSGSDHILALQAYRDRVAAEGTGVVLPPPDTPAAATIAISPQNPPALVESVAGQGAATSFTVTTTGIGRITHVVVRSDGTWREPRQEVNTSGSVTIAATYFASGDFLKVLKTDDFTVFRDGGGVSITLAPGTPAPIGTALQKAQAVVAPLRLGVNIERGEPVFDGWVNDAFLAKIKEQGLTHIRLFPNSGGSYSLYSQNDMTHWYNIVANATENYGILVHLDFLDIMDENQIRTADVENYIRACADSVAARNFNPNLAIFGVCNEYMAGTNVGFEEPRERLTNILHEKLPNHVIVTNSADWGNPWTLVNGTMKVYPSKPRIHQWHWYPDPESQAVAEDVNFYLKKWCRDESAVTINGEYNVNNYPTEYHRWPGVIRNAFKGMPEQRTTMWSIIGKSVSYFRLNEWDSAMLTSDVAAAYVEGDAYIRGLQWYKDGLSGGTTPPPDTATPTITIEPADPGTLTETVSGQGAARTFTVTTTGIAAFHWVVVRPDYSWRTDAVSVNTTGSASISAVFMQTGEFIKVLKSDNYQIYRDSGQVVVNPAPGGEVPVTTDVDAEYPVYVGTPVATGKSGPLQTGQSNCGYFIQEAIWYENEGLASTLGVAKGFFNPQVSGWDSTDAYGLLQGAKTGPDAYTAVGGVPLYDHGDGYPFLDPTGGGNASSWPYGHSGWAMHEFITNVMTSGERSGCMGVQVLHHERDSEVNDDYAEYKAARLNWMAKVRASFGRPATGSNALPIFFVYPHPYGGNGNGHAAIRRAWGEICADSAQNAHVVVGQTCDSWGGLRWGATERDYSHRDTEDLRRYARMAVFGVTRVLNSQRGVGSRNLPSFGPKMVHCHAVDATHTDVTCAHDRGTSLYLGGSAGDGRGWSVLDNGSGRSVTDVSIQSANRLRLTHASVGAGAAQRLVSYTLYGQELGGGNGIYDNFSTRPTPAGWPAGWGSEWKFDWPLRGSMVPMASSSSAYSG